MRKITLLFLCLLLNSYAGESRVMVSFLSEDGVNNECVAEFEDIKVGRGILDCSKPNDLIVDNITGVIINVTWTESDTATEWEILYGEASFDPMTDGTLIMDTDGTVGEILNTLSPNIWYDVYIRATCSANNQSDWAGSERFKTDQLLCDVPTGVATFTRT